MFHNLLSGVGPVRWHGCSHVRVGSQQQRHCAERAARAAYVTRHRDDRQRHQAAGRAAARQQLRVQGGHSTLR